MGEWSEYFEDFPEENPANWINGRFDPEGAAAQRARQRALEAAARPKGTQISKELWDIIDRHRRKSPEDQST